MTGAGKGGFEHRPVALAPDAVTFNARLGEQLLPTLD
jgi:hypothetical protein